MGEQRYCCRSGRSLDAGCSINGGLQIASALKTNLWAERGCNQRMIEITSFVSQWVSFSGFTGRFAHVCFDHFSLFIFPNPIAKPLSHCSYCKGNEVIVNAIWAAESEMQLILSSAALARCHAIVINIARALEVCLMKMKLNSNHSPWNYCSWINHHHLMRKTRAMATAQPFSMCYSRVIQFSNQIVEHGASRIGSHEISFERN